MIRPAFALSVFALAAVVAAPACGPSVDLSKAVEIQVVQSGFFDAGIVNAQIRMLPDVKFTLKNSGTAPLSNVQLFVTFTKEGADGEIDSMMAPGIGTQPLAPGESTAPIAIRCPHGYALDGARADMFTNSQYSDVIVKVFGKQRASFQPIGQFKIDRRIIEATSKTPGRP